MITQLQLPAGARIVPDFTLMVKNKALEQSVRERVMSIKMTDNSGFTADTMEVLFDDSDGVFQMPERGTVLHLHLGWSGQALYDCGSFIVDTVTHNGAPDRLSIVARSADFRGSFDTKGSYSYDDTTLGAIVRLVSQRNKLQLPQLLPELDAITITHIDQTNETDAYFLMRLAQMNGAQATVKQGTILFIKPGYGLTASGKAIPWMSINRSDGDSHSFKIIDKQAYSGVTAIWHDVKKAQSPQVALQRSGAKSGAASSPHPASKMSGESAGSDASEQSYMAGAKENLLVLSKIYADQESATRAADSVFKQIQSGVASFSIKLALGRADLFPQTPVVVSGFKDVIDSQRWIIDSVVHDVADKGFVTTLNLKVYIDGITYQASIA